MPTGLLRARIVDHVHVVDTPLQTVEYGIDVAPDTKAGNNGGNTHLQAASQNTNIRVSRKPVMAITGRDRILPHITPMPTRSPASMIASVSK